MKSVTYAIADVHGRLDLLDRLLDTIESDAADRNAAAKIVFTGDYVDRGMDSFGVVERLIAGPRRATDTFVCLRGNHDDLFAKAVARSHHLPEWVWLLFWHTIASYGVDRDALHRNDGSLRRHAAFLSALPLTHDDGTHLFVHAGIRPGVPIELQAEEDLLWIREAFLEHTGPLPRRIVHGHTIMGDSPVVTGNRISLDTGAYRSGILTAAVIDGTELSFLQAVGEPDRGAIVREALLRASVAGVPVSPDVQRAHDDYVAGRIGLAEMEQRSLEVIAG